MYQQLDEGLGRLLTRTSDDDLVIFMSDHGHQACTRACTMDRILQHLGWLEFGRGSFAFNLIRWGPGRNIARRIYDLLKLHGRISIPASPIDWAKTARLYECCVHRRRCLGQPARAGAGGHRRPPGDYEKVRSEIAASLEEFRDPETGASPIGKIYRKEEVLSGKFLDTAPDLLLVPAPLYSLTHAKGMVEAADWLSGDHRLEGVVVATGPDVTPGPLAETARLIDLGPTAMAALGVPSAVPRWRVLESIAGTGARLEVVAAAASVSDEGDETGLTSDEAGEIEDHLRGLGYVE